MKVEIWSDVVCPWCYIGKRRFEAALEQLEQKEKVEIEWKSFQLDPTTITNTEQTNAQYLSKKYGVSITEAEQMVSNVTQVAAGVGLTYDLEHAVIANTFRAHRLIHLAKRYNKQDEMKERLLKAYFTEAKNIDDTPTLIAIGAELGIDADVIKEVLESDTYSEHVQTDIKEAQQIGVRGVPFFVFNRKYGISGAQETAVFKDTLDKAFAEWQADQPQIEVIDGDACTPEKGC